MFLSKHDSDTSTNGDATDAGGSCMVEAQGRLPRLGLHGPAASGKIPEAVKAFVIPVSYTAE